ncbi:MAG: hypothetical protein L3K18_02270 [Thermoplasmata archaeon]|nr:hypothetical protein [Thermoplasmata archaeon]
MFSSAPKFASIAVASLMLLGIAGTLVAADARPGGVTGSILPASAGAVRGPSVVPSSASTFQAPSLPRGVVPPIVYSGPTPAHLPAAWGSDARPPGAPVPSSSASPPTCVGKWPFGGQSVYASSCLGHDEPAINPFSDLPGSGGNVSWNVSLPVDGGPAHNQSDIYIAIWFGMDLLDPYGYSGQCFLELQMYPDTAGSGAVQVGTWSAFAVAWQIQLSNGQEDPCFAAPLSEPNGTPLQMNAGDHLYVNMTGWQGSTTGEKISVVDTTIGVVSHMTLYNRGHHYPLNPAYLENNVEDALPWSPGGDLPVSFAFESGHTTDNPQNDTFGGCNTGVPPATALNGAVPCGSYSPRDWAMDTKVPWHFYPTTFFNSATRQTAVQYGFEQDFGASAWIDGLSYGTCDGRDGSAYCSYPWYSFDGSLGAFEFGATDYRGTTADFGTYAEFGSTLQADSSGLNFYPIKNFSLPTSAGNSLTIGVHGSGTVHFLNDGLTHSTTFPHLLSGAYSVNAAPASGQYFEGYATTGALTLDTAGSAWNSFQLNGLATLTAYFGPAPPNATSVTFQDTGHHGSVTVVPGFEFPVSALYPPAGPGFGLAPVFPRSATEVPAGGTLSLAPGIYSIEANPRPGYNFTGWSASPGVYVFAPGTNYTWFNVSSTGGTLTAHYQSTSLLATLWLASYPSQGGSLRFGPFTFASGAVFSAAAGTYAVQAIAAPGFQFLGWAPGFVGTMTNPANPSQFVAQYGNDYLTAVFSSTPVVRSGGSGVGGGFALDDRLVVGNVTLPQVGNITYQLESVPNSGFTFSHWSVGNPSQAWVANLTSPTTSIQINGSVTLTPHFVRSATSASVVSRANGGTIEFNAVDSWNGTNTVVVSPGTYTIGESPAVGEMFLGWKTSGHVQVGTTFVLTAGSLADVENFAGEWVPWYNLTVTGSGTVTAVFGATTHPVTFIDFPFNFHMTVTLTGIGGTKVLHAGQTANLPSGVYTLTLGGGTISGLRWFANSNLTFAPPTGATTNVTIAGSGTIYAV